MHLIFPLMIHSSPFFSFYPWKLCWSDSCPFLFAELFCPQRKEETVHCSTELTATWQLRGAFSDTEDFIDHGLVSANRCSSRTSSISSWTENMKPSFTKKLKFQSILEGEAAEFKCKLIACPPPTILWFHNNRSIPKEHRRRIYTDSKMHVHTTSLVIHGVKEKDSGSYKVMAINIEGSAESTASLLVSLREEQSANYLGFIRRTAKAHESIDTMAEQRKERKFRVDLRYVGSPFDKMSKVHQGRSRSKSALVRTVYFMPGSHSEDKEPEKESKRLETASERALSPTPMFDRSERFNDRFSDIYCDRRTGTRFSDKFSDRCSDRYSERFSDTESLHNEVRTKLTTLQKAVKQKKRLSISTMSSSEFELESVASESSYADYVERLRVKPASLPDVQHFNRPFDLGETYREFQGKTSSRDPAEPCVRHSFEPQSRTRAIQLMRGELVSTSVSETEKTSDDKHSEKLEDKKVKGFVEIQADVVDDHKVQVTNVGMTACNLEGPLGEKAVYPETTMYTESGERVKSLPSQEATLLIQSTMPKSVTSTRERFLREDTAATETADLCKEAFAGEDLRARYEKSLEAERIACEEKLLALRIRKWQQGSRMPGEETYDPETDLPIVPEAKSTEPTGHIYNQQEKRATVETEAMHSSFHESLKKEAWEDNPEGMAQSTPTSTIKMRSREVERSASVGTKASTVTIGLEEDTAPQTLMQKSQKSPRTRPRPEDRFRISERFISEKQTPDSKGEKQVEPCDQFTGKFFRAPYEKKLETGGTECEEKRLPLGIRQEGMRISEEETFNSETDLPIPAGTQYKESEKHIHTPQEVMEKKIAPVPMPMAPKVKGVAEQLETSAQLVKGQMKTKVEELEHEKQKLQRFKAKAAEAEYESRSERKARAEKMLFEKTRAEKELQLSRENISDLKSESEKFISEEEALTQRIRKWQQDVLMEQEQTAELQGYSPFQAGKTTEAGTNLAEASALELANTVREKCVSSESAPAGFQDQEGETLQWPLAGELPTEGRVTRLQRDSEYFVSEEEALAQRILKWQQDAVEQEDTAELESEWPQLPLTYCEPHHSGMSHEAHPSEPPPPHLFSTEKPSVFQPIAKCDLSPPFEASMARHPAADASLLHHVGAPDAPVRYQKDSQASSVQKYSPTQLTGRPYEEYELTSASYESHREPSPVRRSSPSLSRQDDSEREGVVRFRREKHAMHVDKSSRQHFQSEVREERAMEKEMGTARENTEWKQQRDERSGDLRNLRSTQGKEMSTEIGAIKKEERRVENVELNIKDLGSLGGSHPVFVKEISSLKVKVGEMSEFICQFQGDPPPTVNWLKDGHPLDHNPDYDIIQKSNNSKLTIFYPTTDHEGTYDCIITNKHGKSICSATLEISNKKVPKVSGVTPDVVKIQAPMKEENQESLIEEQFQTYTDSGKVTLKVPRMEIIKRRSSDESFSTSPVEIRITAATPIPEMAEDIRVDKPQVFTEGMSSGPSSEAASQTVRHKFTFSFDVVGEAPCVVTELENITCSEGETAVLKCVITGEPAPDVTWYHDHICLEATVGKYSTEIHDKMYMLYISNFTYPDAGLYKCVARNKLGEVTSISEVSYQVEKPKKFSGVDFTPLQTERKSPYGLTEDFKKPDIFQKAQDSVVLPKVKPPSSQVPTDVPVKTTVSRPSLSREPQVISGCGLQGSAAVIKVSQIKQTFESTSPIRLTENLSLEEERKKTLFPEEFIPSVTMSLNQQEEVMPHKPDTMHTESCVQLASPTTRSESSYKASHAPVESNKPVSFETSQVTDVSKEVISGVSCGAVKQFLEEMRESPEVVRPGSQELGLLPQHTEAGEAERFRWETFDKTGSHIAFESEKVPAGSCLPTLSSQPEGTVKPKQISKSLKPASQSAVPRVCSVESEAKISRTANYSDHTSVGGVLEEVEKHVKRDVKGLEEEFDLMLEYVHKEGELSGDKLISIQEPTKDKAHNEELISFPEVSIDSGVFGSMLESQDDKREVSENTVADDLIESPTQIKGEYEKIEVRLKSEPETFIVKPKVLTTANPLGRSRAAADRGKEGDSMERDSADQAGGAAAAGSIEEEEVTFGAVYNYYSPPPDWGRPLSPESEMSIEIGSTVSEDIVEVAERFYTPGSSTEVSQPIAQSFHTPKSPVFFHTPSSDESGGFKTPQEYPFSPVEYKRPSTEDSSERFFSPVQFLTSPTDEGIEKTLSGMNVEENQILSQARGSLGLSTLQEKVQGIPPAFLKPLMKKNVFENDTLTFYAEVFGLPSPQVNWFRNKTQLVADDRVTIERDGDSISLTIQNVTRADQGEYICEAVNYVGEARSVAVVIVVSQEVRFTPVPPAVSHQHVMKFDVEEDDSSRSPSPQEILLEVELDENEVKEFEKQVKIITIPEYTADNKSMIISLNVLPSIYEEGAVDFVTQEHDDLKIAFEVTEMPPRFINPICDMENPEGTTVMFECSLMGIPSPIVSWFKGDRKIPQNNKKYLHFSDSDNHFLKICKVTTQDSGVYTCRAINIVGETLCRASLVVLSAKDFSGKTRGRELTAVSLGSAKVQPQRFDLMVGNTSFDGEQVSEIELEFDFEQEADESQRAVRLVANTDNKTSEEGEKYVSIDFDVFADTAKDEKIEFKGKSSDMCSFQFQVTETPPKCIIPLTDVTAAVGTPVILQCLVNGKPNPTAEWYKDGDRITDSRYIIQVKTAGHFNLLITNVTQSDAGEYKCIIQNTAGCIETAALLKVF